METARGYNFYYYNYGWIKEDMDISIIICTFNRSDSLKKTLQTIKEMTVPQGIVWELLVVDNNSKDDTRAMVKAFQKNTSIRCAYYFENRQGQSFARNTGIQNASGNIIVFTDDDVIVDKSWIKNISDAFQGNTDVACIGGKILPVWESPCPEWIKGELLNILALCDLGDETKILSEPKVWGANLSFKTSIIREYGFFDTKLGHKGGKLYGGEETKYLQTLINAGEKIMYFPGALVYHCISKSRLKKKYFRKWYFDTGERSAIEMGEYNKRNIIGIPLIVLRRVLKEMFKFLKSKIVDPDSSFWCQMILFYNMGIIWGRIKYKFGDNDH
jgi:glycosyltransferase involved in cell wall biosynthesis